MEQGRWISIRQNQISEEPEMIYFRKKVNINEISDQYFIKISADTRYKLYINGNLCEVGPLKGDHQVWYYDRIDVRPYLKTGINIWAVQVLYYPEGTNNRSLFSGKRPGLYLEGENVGDWNISSDSTWKVRRISGFHILSENPYFAPLQIYEQISAAEEVNGWLGEKYSDTFWENAEEYMPGEYQTRENLKLRSIPFMHRIPGRFAGVSRVERYMESTTLAENALDQRKLWEEFLAQNVEIELPPYTEIAVDFDAGELMTAYLQLSMIEGKGARIELEQAECYVEKMPEEITCFDDLPVKGDRTDSSKGLVWAYRDLYKPHGLGVETEPEIYEPFWFRTFRYVRLKIRTGKERIRLKELSYVETGYPLKIDTRVETSDPSMEKIWEISARSLRRCMHETYEDCPFYEQLQYIMDSRSQILYTYAISADDRMARKCMDDLARSQRWDGLLAASYPNVEPSVIPGFSVYYIGMLYDHMMYFGDKDFLQKHLPVMNRVLTFYDAHRNQQGLVKKIGGLNRPDCDWSFIDWTTQWRETNGVPGATLQGAITMESLLYLLGLQYAAEICQYLERKELEQIYRQREDSMKKAVNTYCRGKNGMYQDGPGYEEYSQHAQVFAILTGCVSYEEGRSILLQTLENKEDYAQCSVAMMYYLFRAMEKTDLYEKTDGLWNIWRDMLRNHMTTCAEDPVNSRSDCHAWGALALYELPAVILGVHPAAPGYSKIEVKPVAGTLQWAKGEVLTPKGKIQVEWRKEKDSERIICTVRCEEKMTGLPIVS